jgi:DNA-damage-inducible protein D
MDEHLTYVRDQLEKIQRVTRNGQPCWYAREMMEVLGYSEWRVFREVIERAMQACEMSGNFVADHFVPRNG